MSCVLDLVDREVDGRGEVGDVNDAAARASLYEEQDVKQETMLDPEILQPENAASLVQAFFDNTAVKEAACAPPCTISTKSVQPSVPKVERTKPISCDVCGKMFDKIARLVTHIVENHGKDETDDNETDRTAVVRDSQSATPVNNKLITSKRSYMVHKMFPKIKKPLTCDVCKKGFARKSHLISHVYTHMEKRSYSCDGCKRQFEKKEYLIRHVQTTKAYDPCVCEYCGKKFSSWSHLTVHRRVHSRYGTQFMRNI